jgi:hypothetical protein
VPAIRADAEEVRKKKDSLDLGFAGAKKSIAAQAAKAPFE